MRIFDDFSSSRTLSCIDALENKRKDYFFHDSKNLGSNKLAETQTVQYLTFIWK